MRTSGPARPLPWPTRRLFGLDFVSDATIDDVADWLVEICDHERRAWRTVVTPNTDHIVNYERDAALFNVAAEATIVLPDGMPIVWASRLLRRPLTRRMAGSDLFTALWPVLARSEIPVVAMAPSSDVRDRLVAEYPHAHVIVPGWFAMDETDAVDALLDDVISACTAVDARFFLLGLSMEKHHRIAPLLRDRWAATPEAIPIVMLMGAALELHVGVTRRAPRWMQHAGLEWLFRITQDPRRLAKRYLVDDVQFVRSVWNQWRHPA